MVDFVSIDQVLPIRNVVLRNNKGIEFARFAEDKLVDTFHLAYLLNDKVVSVSTFLPANLPDISLKGFQLRGMATLIECAGNGFGKAIVNFAISYLKTKNVNYIWCNARQSALGFYRNLGFEINSQPFEIENIGTHYRMILQLN